MLESSGVEVQLFGGGPSSPPSSPGSSYSETVVPGETLGGGLDRLESWDAFTNVISSLNRLLSLTVRELLIQPESEPHSFRMNLWRCLRIDLSRDCDTFKSDVTCKGEGRVGDVGNVVV